MPPYPYLTTNEPVTVCTPHSGWLVFERTLFPFGRLILSLPTSWAQPSLDGTFHNAEGLMMRSTMSRKVSRTPMVVFVDESTNIAPFPLRTPHLLPQRPAACVFTRGKKT